MRFIIKLTGFFVIIAALLAVMRYGILPSVGYIPSTLFFLWLTARITRRYWQNKSLGVLAASCLFVFMIYDLFWSAVKIEYLCHEHNAGKHIYEKIDNVPGFLSATYEEGCDGLCKDSLLNDGYEFIEAKLSEKELTRLQEAKARRPGYKFKAFAEEPGLYRFTVVNSEEDPRCDISNKWLNTYYAKRYELGLGRLEQYRGRCIATEKIDHLKSKYAISREYHSEEYRGSIRISKSTITEISSQKVIAERIAVGFRPKNFFMANDFLTHRGCKSNTDWLKPTEVLLNQNSKTEISKVKN